MSGLVINNNVGSHFVIQLHNAHPKPSAPPLVEPPSYQSLYPKLDMTTSNTKAATQNWKNLSKNCEKDRLINRIAFAALTVLGILMLAGGVALCVTGVGIGVGAAMCPFGVTIATLTPIFFGDFNETIIKYDDPNEAKKVIDMLKTSSVADPFQLLSPPVHGRSLCRSVNLSHLVKYGFIKEDQKEEIIRRQNEYREEQTKYTQTRLVDQEVANIHLRRMNQSIADYNNFIQTQLVLNLPDPFLIIE